MPFLDRVAVPRDESREQVIEAGSKVMNDFTSENSEPVGNVSLFSRYKDIISLVILKFSDDGIGWRIRSQESGDLSIEILDAFVGPLNFRSTPSQ